MSAAKVRYIVAVCALVTALSSWIQYGEPIYTDAVEYTVAAYRLVNGEGYTLGINGESFPPRYPPLFSALFVSPAFLFTNELRIGALIPTLLTAVGVVFVYEAAALLGGVIAGIVSVICLILLPGFFFFSGMAMTDCLLLTITAFLLFIFIKEKKFNRNYILTATVFSTIAIALKSSAIFLLFPWLYDRIKHKKWRDSLILLLLPIIFLVATTLHNIAVFNDPLRTGYHFWTSVPYDFPSLVFSIKYLIQNINKGLMASFIPIILVFIIAMHYAAKLKSTPLVRHFTVFFCLFGIPTAIFFSVYFFSTVRFYLPLAGLTAILFGVTTANFLNKLKLANDQLITTLALALTIFVVLKIPNINRPVLLKEISTRISSGSLILSDENPVYLQHYLPQVEILPLSRKAEFASKLVSREKPPKSLHPKSASDHRFSELKNYGAREVFNFTALEKPEIVDQALSTNRNVYFIGALKGNEWLSKLYELNLISEYLYTITVKQSHPALP